MEIQKHRVDLGVVSKPLRNLKINNVPHMRRQVLEQRIHNIRIVLLQWVPNVELGGACVCLDPIMWN